MTFAELFPHWEPMRRRMLVFLRGLSARQLAWTPHPQVTSIGQSVNPSRTTA